MPRRPIPRRRLTDTTLIARWLERECLRMRKLGVTYTAMADLIARAARGEKNRVTLPDPELVTLPPGYRVSDVACLMAIRRALQREPAHEVAELRKIATARIEDWLLNLAPRLQRGEPDAVRTGLLAIKRLAELNGFAPQALPANAITNNTLVINEIIARADSVRALEAELSRRVGRPVTLDQAVAALRSEGESIVPAALIETTVSEPDDDEDGEE